MEGRPLSEERRRHRRTPVALPATVHAGGRSIAAEAQDISPGGAFLRCELPADVPRVVATIALPNGRELNVFAHVCWRRGQGVGVQFDRFLAGAESSRILSGFLSGGPANPDAS